MPASRIFPSVLWVTLAEVEQTLAECEGIQAAAVIASDDGRSGNLLDAFLVCMKPAPNDAEIRKRLLAKLPLHMMPTRINRLDNLPLLPNGKVDRNELGRLSVEAGQRLQRAGRVLV